MLREVRCAIFLSCFRLRQRSWCYVLNILAGFLAALGCRASRYLSLAAQSRYYRTKCEPFSRCLHKLFPPLNVIYSL